MTVTSPRGRPDAILFRLCAKRAEINAAINALCETRTTLEVEDATEPALRMLQDKMIRIERRIRACQPVTAEGWRALARAATHCAYLSSNVILASDDAHLIAWAVVAHVAGGAPL